LDDRAKVHGGAMLALCANAARTACGGSGLEPVAVSASFLWAPDPGPMRLVTSIRKRGRRISVADVELTQGERTTIQLTALLRALPADGWLRIVATCVEIGHDWFDEDHVVVDSLGRLVVQARQLAMVPATP
jgi:acyl-CoA thioesterase superfamily protein